MLALFTEKSPDGNNFELRADLKLNSEGQWRGLFGWPDAGEERIVLAARPRAVPKPALAPVLPVAVAKAAPKAAAKAVAKAVAKAAARPSGETLLNGLVWRQGVVEVKALLAQYFPQWIGSNTIREYIPSS